ncbi:MAG: GH92 family glycosyl hydrolase [Pyrinomonadaceae bacterium]
MKKRKFSFQTMCAVLLGTIMVPFSVFAQTDYTKFVNPFIGTGGHGHTFPGATVPFSMVQLSPDTRIDNWDGSGGYHYSDDTIYGFSMTHLSGTGIPDYCDILFAPYVSETALFDANPEDTRNGYASKFKHENEKAQPGYYSVLLDDEKILAEMTATKRVGLQRYTFPEKTSDAKILLDLTWRDQLLEVQLKSVGNNRVEGVRRSRSWAQDQVIYFSAEFSKPFEKFESRSYTKLSAGESDGKESTLKGQDKAVFGFAVDAGEQILVKVGISAVSIEGARKNLKSELPGWNFEQVRNNGKAEWNKELSKIEVSGGTEAQFTNFYTALYHTMVVPNIFQDVDGNYRGMDKKIHNAQIDSNYTIFSLWDTFRAAHPLYTIIDQRRTVDFINTFIRQYEQGGKLPVWELAANETDTMIGYHAVSVIADAMAKGIKGFDYEKAFEAAKHSSEMNFRGLDSYRKRGYISMEDEQESVSKTLEYAYDDYCLAVIAKLLNKQKEYQTHLKRAQFYKNLFDSKTGFMRPKQNGNWVSPFQPNDVTFHFTEGNSWQYTFFVPQDVSGLISLYGGNKKFINKLDELFATEQTLIGREQPDITGLIGQYAHGNEPSHHIAYLYDYSGEPWKTQNMVRRIMDEFYKPIPDGLIGNEDCGQMSAWYVMSALGFYQVNPSQPIYAIGTPIFAEAQIHLENGKTFIVKQNSANTSALPYIQSVKLNGKDYRKAFFTQNDILSGAKLQFQMTDKPVKNWFTEVPVSKIETNFPPVPTIEGKRAFAEKTVVSISSPEAGIKIYYTLDGSEPSLKANIYSKPFAISKSTTVKAISVDKLGRRSQPVQSTLSKIPNNWDVKLLSTYNNQYTGGGANGLVDGIRGTTNFASGEWQGYQGQDLVAIIDLKRETEIHKLGGGFLQAARSWIWMPQTIEFEISDDGVNFKKVSEISPKFSETEMEHIAKDFVREIEPVKARFVRVTAKGIGKIPAWHPGAGFDSYIFVDEIIIE